MKLIFLLLNYYSVIYSLSIVPAVCSAVMKEALFRGEAVDMNVLNTKLLTFQALIGLILAPILFLPLQASVFFMTVFLSI